MSVVKGLLATSLACILVSVLGCSSSSSSDSTPPVISNLSHTDNQKVTGSRTITVSADVTDETSLSSVTITHNGMSQTVTDTSGNYAASITLEDRTNNVVVVTANDADNTTTQTINLDYPFLEFTNGQAASVVIGQPNFDSIDINQGGTVNVNTLNKPYDVRVINNRLYIADRDNNRVLGFNSIPTANNPDADFVIGQDSFTTNTADLTSNRLNFPHTIDVSDTQLFIGHSADGRINVWSDIPITNTNATHVIGQLDFGTGTAFGCEQNIFNLAVDAVVYIEGKIIATDIAGNRVLVWNTVPTTNGVTPNLVLGQQSLTKCAANDLDDDGVGDGVPSASTLSSPNGVWSDGTRLVIGDKLNNRVLIWNTFPTTNFQAADLVLGQADFVTGDTASANNATEFSRPFHIHSNGNQLFVGDKSRILIWNTWPTNNEQAADRVLGMPNFTINNNGSGNDRLSNPRLFSTDGNKLFVSDTENHRVLIFQAP